MILIADLGQWMVLLITKRQKIRAYVSNATQSKTMKVYARIEWNENTFSPLPRFIPFQVIVHIPFMLVFICRPTDDRTDVISTTTKTMTNRLTTTGQVSNFIFEQNTHKIGTKINKRKMETGKNLAIRQQKPTQKRNKIKIVHLSIQLRAVAVL